MKIIDTFMFYNELDMLYYRLSILYDIVDYFVIVEATLTHAGNPKKLYYDENKEKFAKFADKIIHVIDDQLIENINDYELHYNEHHHRDYIYEGIKQLNLDDNDKIIISDLDELPDPNAIRKIKAEKPIFNNMHLEMDMYWYNLTCKCTQKWIAPIVSHYALVNLFDKSSQKVRMGQGPRSQGFINPGGWHLTYFGDYKFIRNKLEQFCHSNEFNFEKYKGEDNIKKNIKEYSDLFMRPANQFVKISISENNYLPPEYQTYLQQYITNIYEYS